MTRPQMSVGAGFGYASRMTFKTATCPFWTDSLGPPGRAEISEDFYDGRSID
jgi:hypothetical protein